MKKSERQAYLERVHVSYCDYNQKPNRSDQFMADNAHPFADDYRRLRAAFDRLRYACNSSARIVAFKDNENSVDSWAPGLEVAWNPTGSLSRYAVYPAHPGWMDYLQAAAREGWPEGCDPKLDSGQLLVTTTDARLVGRLFVAAGGFVVEQQKGVWKARIRTKTAAPMLECLRVVERQWRRWTPPARDARQDAEDAAPLPVAQRPFRFSNVDQVTMTDRVLLVPLITADARGALKGRQIATDLVNLCRSEEYPYFGAVRDWLVGVLAAGDIKKLDREFRQAATV